MDQHTHIKTKLQRPRLGQDLILRPHLIACLHEGLDRKLTLISAQAGAGKTTLLLQWLEECPQTIAWLSLDEYDNDLVVFVSYFCAAIQSATQEACTQTLDLLSAPQLPPLRVITAALVNELDALLGRGDPSGAGDRVFPGLILAIDDFQNINEPAIHELLSDLIAYLPRDMHMVLTSRMDPLLPLAALRAHGEMTELRTSDLRLSAPETEALLEITSGRKLSRETITLLDEKTEGWVVGLRLAALSLRYSPDVKAFVERFKETSSSAIVDYLVNEVLSQQSPRLQDFLLRTSILDRFNAELCDAVLWQEEDTSHTMDRLGVTLSRHILREVSRANLFLIALDQGNVWFRYHHLFRDLLQLRLRRQHDPEQIATLHIRASQWFEQHGFIEEALNHALMAGDTDRAIQVLAGQRYSLMNDTQWQRLERFLHRFPTKIVAHSPDLLMLKAWLIYHQGHYAQLPDTLRLLEGILSEGVLPSDEIRYLQGEVAALRSLLSYHQSDADQTIVEAEFALLNTPPRLWIVRALARLFLAGALQMRGDASAAYETLYHITDEEAAQERAFRATTLTTSCFLHWVTADLQGLLEAASQCLALSDYTGAAEIEGYAHYHLGCAYYHLNDLAAAEEQFAIVVRRPYMNYGDCYANSACGLALTYQAQDRPEDAREVVASAVAYLLETGNATLLPVARAFQAELSLRQGQLATADQWAGQIQTVPPLTPMTSLLRPHLALAKIWLAHKERAKHQQAADLLREIEQYAALTHNTAVLIEVLALLALLYAAQGDEPAALEQLEQALKLAQLGGFVRLFVDLGLPLASLLQILQQQSSMRDYIAQILDAFHDERAGRDQSGPGSEPPEELVDPLTPRELEVLALLAKRLTSKEIAEELFVSPGTVKTHTLSIYAKLDVRGRWQAVDKAKELGVLLPT